MMNFSKTKKLLHSFKVIHTNGSTNSYLMATVERKQERECRKGKRKYEEKRVRENESRSLLIKTQGLANVP